MLALDTDILGFVFGVVVIFEGACQRLHRKKARPYSTGAIQAGSVVTCRAVHRARCWRQKLVVAIIDLDVDRFGHIFTDVFALAMLCIHCCLCIMVLIIGFESHDGAFDILNSKWLL